jgi:hypothetical protein
MTPPMLSRVRKGALAGLGVAILALGVGLVRALLAILGGEAFDLMRGQLDDRAEKESTQCES